MNLVRRLQGLVERARDESDGRGQVAVLTPAGLRRLELAWPTHLASVRKHVMDHLSELDLVAFAKAMSSIAAAELGPPVRRGPQPAEMGGLSGRQQLSTGLDA
jgi:hypothetical protein